MAVLPSPLPPRADILARRRDLALAAQRVYDAWAQDEHGVDEDLGTGGICQDVAAAMAGVLDEAGIDVWTQCANHEQHVYCVAACAEGVVEIDIPYGIYETGAGYVWRKKPGVRFDEEDVVVDVIDHDPRNAPLYRESDDAMTMSP